jgi:hypothetical protein
MQYGQLGKLANEGKAGTWKERKETERRKVQDQLCKARDTIETIPFQRTQHLFYICDLLLSGATVFLPS